MNSAQALFSKVYEAAQGAANAQGAAGAQGAGAAGSTNAGANEQATMSSMVTSRKYNSNVEGKHHGRE